MPAISSPSITAIVKRERARPNRVKKFTVAYSCKGRSFTFWPSAK